MSKAGAETGHPRISFGAPGAHIRACPFDGVEFDAFKTGSPAQGSAAAVSQCETNNMCHLSEGLCVRQSIWRQHPCDTVLTFGCLNSQGNLLRPCDQATWCCGQGCILFSSVKLQHYYLPADSCTKHASILHVASIGVDGLCHRRVDGVYFTLHC